MTDPELSIRDNVRVRVTSYLDMLKASSDRFSAIHQSTKIIKTMSKLQPIMGDGVSPIKDSFCDHLSGYIIRHKEMFQNPITSNVNITNTHDLLNRDIEIACTYAVTNNRSLLLHTIYEDIVRHMERYKLESHTMDAAALTQMTIRGIICAALFKIADEMNDHDTCPRCASENLVHSKDVHSFIDMPDAWCGLCQSYFIKNKYGSLEYTQTVVGGGVLVYDIIGKEGTTLLSTHRTPPSIKREKIFATSYLSGESTHQR